MNSSDLQFGVHTNMQNTDVSINLNLVDFKMVGDQLKKFPV